MTNHLSAQKGDQWQLKEKDEMGILVCVVSDVADHITYNATPPLTV